MQHVRQELSHLEERLEFKQFYDWLDSEGEPNLGTRCQDTVRKLLSSADEDIYSRMSKIMSGITAKVPPPPPPPHTHTHTPLSLSLSLSLLFHQ